MADIQKPDMSNQWANSGNKTPPSTSKINSGWVAGEIPLESDFNYVDGRQDQGLAYLLQKGITEWDSSTEYQENKSYVQYGGNIYRCIQTGTNKQPNTNPAYWRNEQGVSPSRLITGFNGTGVADKALIYFAGLSVEGDGGGGPLRFLAGSTATANGVTIYAVTGGRLVREGYTVFGINVKWAGAKSGVDSTAEIQAACSAGKYVRFGDQSDAYLVSGTIALQSGAKLVFDGASITQLTDQTPIFNANSTTGVEITGGVFNGKSESTYNNTPSSQAICIKADNAVNLKVWNNTFNNFWYSPLMVNAGGDGIEFVKNKVVGPGSSVLGVDVNRRNTTGATVIGKNIRVCLNEITGTAQGLIIGQGSTDIIVAANNIYGMTNEHGIYADTGIKRLVVSDNVIHNTGINGTGLKVQSYDTFGVLTESVSITGNVISDTGGDGILIDNTASTPTLRALGVVISNNTIHRAGAYGIDVRDAEDCVVSDNIVVQAATSAIAWGNCENLKVIDNMVRNCQLSGMRDLSPSNNVQLRGNAIRNSAIANAGSDRYGILINDGGINTSIEGNVISDADAKMQYGIFVVPNINSTLSIVENTVLNSTDGGLRLGNTGALREYRGNLWSGTAAATFNEPAISSVASAANITLPQLSRVVSITGTTSITSINATGHSGSVVTLVFSDALTVVRGSNLLLNQSLGNYVTTGGDTLTLACDGVYWYEMTRSAN